LWKNEETPREWVPGFVARNQSSESWPSRQTVLNAFCRVALSDRFNFLAILAAGVFFRASIGARELVLMSTSAFLFHFS
jgi:hypothetical protein